MLQMDSLIDVVDELSKVRRDIDALKVRESELRGQLIEASEKYDDQEIELDPNDDPSPVDQSYMP